MRGIDFKYMNLKKAYDRLVEVSNLYDGKNDISKFGHASLTKGSDPCEKLPI